MVKNKQLNYSGYCYLLNRIAYYLVANKKTFTARKQYVNLGKQTTYNYIINKIQTNGKNYKNNEFIAKFVECAITDNKNTDFLPNYVLSKDEKRKYSKTNYIDMIKRVIAFEKTNTRHPTTVNAKYEDNTTTTTTTKKTSTTKKTTKKTTTGIYNSKPHYTEQGAGKLGQETSYYCGPNCVHQTLKKFGITKYSQSTIAKYAGTTTSGTDPDSLKTAIDKIAKLEGIKLKVERKYLSDFGKTTDEQFKEIGKLLEKSNTAVFFHLGYQDSGSASKDSQGKILKIFGHYEMFDTVDMNKKQVRVLNSLGNKCTSTAYCGHLQWRTFSLEKTYINNKTGVKSVWVVTKA